MTFLCLFCCQNPDSCSSDSSWKPKDLDLRCGGSYKSLDRRRFFLETGNVFVVYWFGKSGPNKPVDVRWALILFFALKKLFPLPNLLREKIDPLIACWCRRTWTWGPTKAGVNSGFLIRNNLGLISFSPPGSSP